MSATSTNTNMADTDALMAQTGKLFQRKRMVAFGVPALIWRISSTSSLPSTCRG